MAPPHDFYKTEGSSSPLAEHLFKLLKIVLIILLVLLTNRSTTKSSSWIDTARINLDQNRLSKTSFVHTESPEWPSSTSLHAFWPDKVLYLGRELGLNHADVFTTNQLWTSDQWGYATWEKTGTRIKVFDPSGKKLFDHQASAWPRAIGSPDWILLYTGDQSGIALLNRKSGDLAGPYLQLASLITAAGIDESDKSLVFGTVDGYLEKYSIENQETIWRVKVPAGEIASVKGLTLCQDENSIIIISGSKPEYISRYSSKGKRLWSTKTGDDTRAKISLHSGKKVVIAPSRRELVIYSLNTGSRIKALKPDFPSEARITWSALAETSGENLVVSASTDRLSAVYFLDRDLKIRDCRYILSPWVEITAANEAPDLIALAHDDGIKILRKLETTPWE